MVGDVPLDCPFTEQPGSHPVERTAGGFWCSTCGRGGTMTELAELTVHQLEHWAARQEKLSQRLHEDCKDRDSAAFADFESVCLADVEPESVTFVWYPYIARGKLTIIEGDPGQGKSFITLAIATAISLGCGLPGMGEFEPGEALIFTAEDGLGDTLRPRLDAMQANVSRIHAWDQPVNLSEEEGLKTVERMIDELRPQIVFSDPIVAYVGPRTDTHRANQVRSILAPLAILAQLYGCAIVVVRHLSKGKSARAIYRGQGSIDFTAAARSVLLAGSDKNDRKRHALVHIKANLTAPGPSLGYSITGGSFAWTGESTLTAADLLAEESSSEAAGATSEAREFLREILKDGPVPAKEVLRQAGEVGLAERTLRDAKRLEGVKTVKEGFGKGSTWSWRLPEDDSEPRRLQENTEVCKTAALAANVQPSQWGEV